ncbi:MAG: hypothetical protein WD512_20060 [Candidatus Paceibacterota bacterium]
MTELTLEKRVKLIAITTKKIENLCIEHAAEKKAIKLKQESENYPDDYDDDYCTRYNYSRFIYQYNILPYNFLYNNIISESIYSKPKPSSNLVYIEEEYRLMKKYQMNLMKFTESKKEVLEIIKLNDTIKVDKYDLLRAQEKLIPF